MDPINHIQTNQIVLPEGITPELLQEASQAIKATAIKVATLIIQSLVQFNSTDAKMFYQDQIIPKITAFQSENHSPEVFKVFERVVNEVLAVLNQLPGLNQSFEQFGNLVGNSMLKESMIVALGKDDLIGLSNQFCQIHPNLIEFI